MEVKVNESLTVEAVAGSAQLRIVHKDGGVLVVELHEVSALVAALSYAASQHGATLGGRRWEVNPF